MLRRASALKYKRTPGYLLGVAVLVMTLAACAGSAPIAPKVPHSPPDWFDRCPRNYDSEKCGFGQGKTAEIAKTRAITDLANRIFASVDSHHLCITDTQFIIKTNVKEFCRERVSMKAKGTFTDLQPLKSECFHTGICYAVVKWDIATVVTKAKRQLQKLGDACIPGNMESFLYTSDFAVDIQKDIRCLPSWRLERIQGQWHINIGENAKPILVSPSPLEVFFPHVQNKSLRIHLFKKSDTHENEEIRNAEINVGERFSLTVENDQEGFLYIFIVTAYGQAQNLTTFFVSENGNKLSGKRLSPPATWRIPHPPLRAEALDGATDSSFRDHFIAARCKNIIKTDDIWGVGEKQEDVPSIDDEISYNVHHILNRLQSCTLSTKILKIRIP